MAYWLFKTEPDHFSIDDLAAIYPKSERWNGIRNYQARNFLRDDISKNDEVLIYHSQCKKIGIVGTAIVTQPAYVDQDQFDIANDYYDAKANLNKPRWYCVDIQFKQIFKQTLTLQQIKQEPKLQSMILLKQGRLSIQPVTQKEWQVIMHYVT